MLRRAFRSPGTSTQAPPTARRRISERPAKSSGPRHRRRPEKSARQTGVSSDRLMAGADRGLCTTGGAMGVLDRFRLDGRVALVTGGARGFGRVFAEALASAGASVVLTARDPARAQAVAEEVA